MSAKHKRPFYVFAAVAAVCCLVLVTGIRGSRADDGRGPVVAGPTYVDAGGTISPDAGAPDARAPDSHLGGVGGSDSGLDGGLQPTTPDLDDSLTDDDGGDAESGPDSGLIVMPPLDLLFPPTADPGEAAVPPVTDGKSDGKGRGGKKDKDRDKDEQGDDSEAEAEAEPEDDSEVDPDVYGLPEDDQGGEGEQSEDPVEPEATPSG